MDFSELEQKLRTVPLYKDLKNLPYEKAKISLIKAVPDELLPLQKYLMEDRLTGLSNLRHELLESTGVDINSMSKGYIMSDGESSYGLIPPVVEVSYYERGFPRVILDGIHRVWLALAAGENINVLLVEDVDFPLPAFPNRWEDIVIYSTPPDDSIKRTYRCYDRRFYSRFRRDLNSMFKTGDMRM